MASQKLEIFCMPKNHRFSTAFDSEEIHKIIREELKASSMILPKKRLKNSKYRLCNSSSANPNIITEAWQKL